MSKVTALKQGRGRPSKSAQEVEENRQRLISIGVALLTRKGFGATGLDEVTKKAGLPKGSFYAYFDSKEAFGLALIDSYARFFNDMLDSSYLNKTYTPLQRVENFIMEARFNMAKYDFNRGCLVGNLGMEIYALPGVYRQRLVDVFCEWQHKTETCLLAAQALGEIAPNIDCAARAELFWIGWEGAILRAKLERRAAPIDVFKADFLTNLQLQS
ncbi:MAG: TetR/AcrR family transcriptional regulator [Gammaproteobacteria bacterium]|jgi:TetR/AcrR family transcriptional repressor of nem operon|nr:TetR/AcrR family transcriptional regulator [Gammaproteobacteria bacterium]